MKSRISLHLFRSYHIPFAYPIHSRSTNQSFKLYHMPYDFAGFFAQNSRTIFHLTTPNQNPFDLTQYF